ncbi:hypothetical protein L3X38_041657 [Prunus dulcis]|uniref:Integrase catalytic domain-containing protein n=1 Tax=Prunus dulcis TaxID=3755 RepID=A0AAD4UUT3_PRUDU|nr:hypothetical protein L3X38_041657 [Prunus dulcis]
MFKIFQTEVERQLEKKIKIMRLDRLGEYYGHFDEGERRAGPFARYLQDNRIVAQYTKPGTLQQNGLVERRNRTMHLCEEMIKTANYMFNRVPN